MQEIKLITKDTNLKEVLHPLNWDVNTDADNELKAYRVYSTNPSTGEQTEYKHSIGSMFDNVWCCPRNEEPTYENLIPFNGYSVRWGFTAKEENVWRDKFGLKSIEKACEIEILRNGEVFNVIHSNVMSYGISKAQVLIAQYNEHPLMLNEYEYDKKCVGRKIRYNGVPGEIVNFCKGRACVYIRPLPDADADKFFSNPHQTDDEYIEDFYEEAKQNNEMLVDIMSEHIWWWLD